LANSVGSPEKAGDSLPGHHINRIAPHRAPSEAKDRGLFVFLNDGFIHFAHAIKPNQLHIVVSFRMEVFRPVELW
jgi:hypothetical protein